MTRRRFRFSLEQIRRLRRHAEREAMRSLASELERAAFLERELELLERRLEAARRRGGGASAADLASRQAYLEHLEREVAGARARAGRQRARVEDLRGELARVVRDRESIDRLKERRRALHESEGRRAERLAGDELALRAATRAGGPA
ncbi:MAG TPA: flagellar FliJ family protein [Gaiellaceae bacterium]|nr:flagellar FliJ family protein [Gaiellaceae bacterium]